MPRSICSFQMAELKEIIEEVIMNAFRVAFRSIMPFLMMFAVMGIANGQTDEAGRFAQDRIPNMLGWWISEASVFYFENVDDPSGEPIFGEGQIYINITHQNGRVFAGTVNFDDKLTGAIAPDGTISMQSFGGNDRFLYSAKLQLFAKKEQISGFINTFEDLNRASFPSMATAFFQATRIE